jgi:hypothetical protein
MTIPNIGHLTIGGVAVPCDPTTYIKSWPKRYSVDPVLGGDVVIQHFGRFKKDMTVEIDSGEQYIDFPTVKLLDALVVSATPVAVVDWEGSDYDGYITLFRAVETFIGRREDDSLLYRWSMSLQVTELRTLRGVAYAGA